MRTSRALLLPILLACLSCGRSPQEPQESLPSLGPSSAGAGPIRGLGTLGGPGSTAAAVNDRGSVVGTSGNPAGEAHAFLWEEATGMVDLGPGAAVEINDRGQVLIRRAAGYVLWTPKTGDIPTGIGPLHEPKDLNNLGQIVGRTAFDRAFLWTPEGGLTPLDELGEGWSEASALNDAGTIVGFALTDRFRGPFLLRRGEPLVPIETYPGSIFSRPVELNERGQVVCAALYPVDSIPFRTYVWSRDGGILDVGPGSPTGINERGCVVGTTLHRKGQWSYGFYWEPGRGVQSLRWMAPRPLGSSAADLNETGQVVGACTWVDPRDRAGRIQAALWTLR